MRKYIFRPKEYALITPHLARRVIDEVAKHGTPLRIRVTLDIGLTYVDALITDDSLRVNELVIDLNELRGVASETAVHALMGDSLKPIQFYDGGLRRFYKLKAVGESIAPTLEINGIHMHRVEGIDPWRDSRLKVRCLGRVKGGRVLDICTGLGYTAISSLIMGASEVVSIELDENVLKIAELNPWSRGLVGVKVLLGDAAEVIKELPSNYFTHIIHDPPRFSMAGHLYSLEFYREVGRVMVRGGRLYHYVGRPGKLRRVNLARGVKERLRAAGFTVIKWDEVSEGLVAVKA